MRKSLFLITLLLVGSTKAFDWKPEMVKSATAQDDAKAKEFTPDPNRGLIYSYRENAFLGQDATSQLVINNKIVAENKRNHFVIVSVEPGTYELQCVSMKESNLLAGIIHNKKKPALPLTVEAGKLYFIHEIFKSNSGFSLKEMTKEEAEPVIKKGTLLSLNHL